ncbi:hypothetical protein ACOMHN_055880 [Nucella lapillus]
MCESDGDCGGHDKCCVEDKARLCRPPLYVTRFQMNVTLSADWKPKYGNVHHTTMVDLANKLKDKLDDMKGYQSCKLIQSIDGEFFGICTENLVNDNNDESFGICTENLVNDNSDDESFGICTENIANDNSDDESFGICTENRVNDNSDDESFGICTENLVNDNIDSEGNDHDFGMWSEGGKVKVVVEVVASPAARKSAVTDMADSLKDQALAFDGAQRLVTAASLRTHGFCGSAGCGTGDCVQTTLGSRCLCPDNVYGDRCQHLDPCEGGVCQNGGACSSTRLEDGSGYNHTCHCPPGYWGNTCQVSVCELFPPDVCSPGVCVGDLRRGQLCSCPLTRRGLFCQDNGTGLPYSECERRHRLNNYLADVLKGTQTMAGVTADRLKATLRSLLMDWLVLVTCQRDGRYVLTSQVLSVDDVSTVRHVCLDRDGEVEVNCQSKVCSAMASGAGGHLCQHGGRCVGNIHLMLCNCSGTGHRGALCQLTGEDDLTQCEHKHNLAQITLDALGGNVEVGGRTKQQVKALVSTLLQDIHLDTVWQPNCTSGGGDGYRGCEFRVSDQGIKECYCLDQQLERIASIPASTTGLPDCPLSGACGEFSSDPCGAQGTCTGDINAGVLCRCQPQYSGVMCDLNTASTQTECKRRAELSSYILSVLHGYKQPPVLLKSSMTQLLVAAAIPALEVPACRPDDGRYKYICTYRLSPLSLHGCKCTNQDGTYKTGAAAACADLGEKVFDCQARSVPYADRGGGGRRDTGVCHRL